jgi:hypothetical protein
MERGRMDSCNLSMPYNYGPQPASPGVAHANIVLVAMFRDVAD